MATTNYTFKVAGLSDRAPATSIFDRSACPSMIQVTNASHPNGGHIIGRETDPEFCIAYWSRYVAAMRPYHYRIMRDRQTSLCHLVRARDPVCPFCDYLKWLRNLGHPQGREDEPKTPPNVLTTRPNNLRLLEWLWETPEYLNKYENRDLDRLQLWLNESWVQPGLHAEKWDVSLARMRYARTICTLHIFVVLLRLFWFFCSIKSVAFVDFGRRWLARDICRTVFMGIGY